MNYTAVRTHYGVGAKGLIKSIDYLTENFKNLQMNKVPEITCKGPFRANLKNLESVCATCEGIAKQGYHILTSGHRPLMIARRSQCRHGFCIRYICLYQRRNRADLD